MPVVPALARAARHHDAERAHTGTVILRLRYARHRDALQEALASDPHVDWASTVPLRHIAAHHDPLMPALRMWHHGAVRLDEARALPRFREPTRIRVAVLDTGVDLRHPALRGRVSQYVHRMGHWHASADDVVGHGTHVSGIIAAADNELGVRGMCRCDLSVCKIFGAETFLVHDGGKAYRLFFVDPVAYRAALQRCLDSKVHVVNMSLGGNAQPDPHERALFDALLAQGTVLVAAMGNAQQHRNRESFPAAVPGVIAVGAVGESGRIADFSCTGPHIALVAPGEDIWSTLPVQSGEFGFKATRTGRRAAGPNPLERNRQYDAWPGTSMACPQVTAAVAMLLATRGPMSPAEVKRRLMRTATRLPAMRGKSFTSTYGAGRLDVARLLSER